jgi:hypothetical protein
LRLNVIRLLSVSTADANVDVGPKGPSPGDLEGFSSRLFNRQLQFGRQRGAYVGRDGGTLRLNAKKVAIFDANARLPGGTIHTHGVLKAIGNGAYRIAVVGGTGVYEEVRGSLTIGAPITPNKALNTYRLIYPLIA